MAGQILLTNLTGFVEWVNAAVPCGMIQQFGNFPRADQDVDEPGNAFEFSARYQPSGRFSFNGYAVSAGQQVLFDIAQGPYAAYATNVRVP